MNVAHTYVNCSACGGNTMLLTDSGYRGRRHARGSKRKKLKTKGSAMILSIVKYSNLSLSFHQQRNGLGAIYRVEVRDLNQ